MTNSESPDEEPNSSLSSYERSVLGHGAAWFFFILFSYYVLRPIREQISSTYGTENLSWLFWATFAVMLVAIPAYSYLVGKFHRRKLVPSIYLLFISNLLMFWAAMKFGSDAAQIWVARAFFVWISVYGLFIVSFFWSVIGDMLTTGQGRKYFGYMAGGGTIGGLAGSQTASLLVKQIGVANLLLIPAGLLTAGLIIYLMMERSTSRLGALEMVAESGKATGGNPFAGFTAVFKSRYMMSICGYGVFLAVCGTTVYFQQSEIVKEAYDSLPEQAAKESRTQYFANINFYVSLLTLLLQFVVVGYLMKYVGLGKTLAALPIAYIIGISALAFSPTIGVLAIVSVLGRSAEYGIANPAREVLFTSVNREERYKAKSFIDTIVRRGGDTTVGSLYQGLRESAGMAMSTLSLIVIPVAVVWAGLALYIGIENKRVVAKNEDESGIKLQS
jgi:AAA family ATP:ADP antiporter